uniref:Putative tail tubular protein n=1 Tax=viral metagenome TaxID=1070528 RepID=A0A6M3IHP3_9ZZZZ
MKFLQNLLLNIAILSLIFAPVAFASNTYRGIAPTYSVDFLQNTSDQKGDIGSATVNRVSGVWSADSTGKLVALRGDRTNYIQRSWQFDSTTAYWTATNANANTQNISAFGVSTATYLKNSGGNGSHSLKKNNEAFNGRYAWYTIHAKSVDYNWIRIDVADGGETNGYTHYFDMSNGVFGTGAAIGAGSLIRAYSDNTGLSAGEYRIGILVDLSAIYTTCDLYIYVAEADGDVTINDDGKGIYIYGAQLEALEGPEAIPGDELAPYGDFSAVTLAAAKTVSGITKANPGVVTFAAGHGYSNRMVIYFSGLTEMTELNGKYFMLRSNAGDTFQLSNQPIATWDASSLDTSGYGAAEATGGACAQRATATALTIYAANFGPGVNGAGALTGKLDCNGSAANGSAFLGVVKNATHIMELSFTLSNYTSGSFRARLGGATCVTATVTSDGTYTARGVGADHLYLDMMTTPFIGSIDNVTLKEISAPGGYDDGWEPGPYTETSGAIGTIPSNIGITEYGYPHPGRQWVNHCLHPLFIQDADAYWQILAGTGTEASTTGIDGGAASGWTLNDTDNSTLTQWIQPFICPADTAYNVFVVYIKKKTSTSIYQRLGLAYTEGNAGVVYVDAVNGTLRDSLANPPDNSGILSAGDFWYVWVSRQNNSKTAGHFSVSPAGADTLDGNSDPSAIGSATFSHPGFYKDVKYPPLYWVGIPDGDNTSPVGQTTNAGSATNGMYHVMSTGYKALTAGTMVATFRMGFGETSHAAAEHGWISFDGAPHTLRYDGTNIESEDDSANVAGIAGPAWVYGDTLRVAIMWSETDATFDIGYSHNGGAWSFDTGNTFNAFNYATNQVWFWGDSYPKWVQDFKLINRRVATTWVESHY